MTERQSVSDADIDALVAMLDQALRLADLLQLHLISARIDHARHLAESHAARFPAVGEG